VDCIHGSRYRRSLLGDLQLKVTIAQIAIYKRYGGDEDGFARIATTTEKQTMLGVGWAEIRGIAQALSLIHRGLATREFEEEIQARIRSLCADDAAVAELQSLP